MKKVLDFCGQIDYILETEKEKFMDKQIDILLKIIDLKVQLFNTDIDEQHLIEGQISILENELAFLESAING